MNITGLLKKYWLLAAILLLAGSLRLYGLLQNPISLYSDEVDMGYQAFSLLSTGCDYSGHCYPIQFHSFSDVQPPLPIYSIALLHFVGVPLDLAIRLSSAIFGLLGILATYFLVETLVSKKFFNLNLPMAGLFASGVLMLVPWHLTYSRIGFSLAMLYFFVTTGLYLFTQYLSKKRSLYLYLACLFLGLTPMVYNTAKMAIIFYPFVLLLLPGAFSLFKSSLKFKISLVMMFVPVCLMFLAGGTTARFDYISIFTDPTAFPEVNYERLTDSGPGASVGTSPSIATKIFHNKPLWFGGNLSDNVFSLLSTDFLFTKGDPNLRHSPENWGMLYRSLLPILLIGIYFLIRFRHDRLLCLLLLLVAFSISTAAITREGSNHASRSFMMVLPCVLLAGIGLAYLFSIKKVFFSIFVVLLLAESVFFVHDYWFHYRYDSERSWSAGMKDVIVASQKYPGQPIIISPKNDNPLIFWLYYTQFDPKKFQQLVKSNTVYNNMSGTSNLEGNRIGDTNLYIATPVEYKDALTVGLPGAVYFLTRLEVDSKGAGGMGGKSAIIKLPSGEPLFYEISL